VFFFFQLSHQPCLGPTIHKECPKVYRDQGGSTSRSIRDYYGSKMFLWSYYAFRSWPLADGMDKGAFL